MIRLQKQGSICSGKVGSLWSGKRGSVYSGKVGSVSPEFPIKIDFTENALDRLKTNSLVDVLQYGSSRVESHWGGLGFAQYGRFEGFSEDGESVWRAFTTEGFNIGYSPPQAGDNLKWRPRFMMSREDSIKSAIMNYNAAKGDTAEFGKYIRANRR